LEGKSLVPVMKGMEDGQDRCALSENYRGGFAGRMIRTAKWKYCFYTNGEEYLYDMQADPNEEQNLIKNPALRKTADELKQRASAGWIATPPKKAKGKKAA
jgi:arylsulfatase A-like enzyme